MALIANCLTCLVALNVKYTLLFISYLNTFSLNCFQKSKYHELLIIIA